jgi:uncharacterized protein
MERVIINDYNYYKSIYIILTEQCNLACKYCFEPGVPKCNDKMSDDVIHKAVDFAFQNAIRANENNVHFTFFGGEPLLHPDGILELARYAENKKAFYNEYGFPDMDVSYNVITNGMIYNEDFMKGYYDILGSKMRFQVSIDGIPEVQNSARVTVDGKATSDTVEKNIKLYQDFFRRHNLSENCIGIHSCISKYSVAHLYESYNYFKELNVNGSFAMVLEEPWTYDDVNKFDEQLNLVLRDCIDKHIKFPFAGYSGRTIACSGGVNEVHIVPNGEIWPCSRLYFITRSNPSDGEKFILGNVNDDPYLTENKPNILKDTINGMNDKYSIKENGRTKICMAVNYAKTGQLDTTPDPQSPLTRMVQLINMYQDYHIDLAKSEGWFNERWINKR